VRRLVLVAPLGLFDSNEPPADLFAQRLSAVPRLLCAQPERYEAFLARPDEADAVDWEIETARARRRPRACSGPLTDTGLAKRLHRISAPTLVVWGAEDRLVPPSYAKRFADALGGPARSARSPARGTWSELDAPDALADAGHGLPRLTTRAPRFAPLPGRNALGLGQTPQAGARVAGLRFVVEQRRVAQPVAIHPSVSLAQRARG
jgi:pimeloyl-ACP methyl ester carboxylesterase